MTVGNDFREPLAERQVRRDVAREDRVVDRGEAEPALVGETERRALGDQRARLAKRLGLEVQRVLPAERRARLVVDVVLAPPAPIAPDDRDAGAFDVRLERRGFVRVEAELGRRRLDVPLLRVARERPQRAEHRGLARVARADERVERRQRDRRVADAAEALDAKLGDVRASHGRWESSAGRAPPATRLTPPERSRRISSQRRAANASCGRRRASRRG